MNDDVSRGNVVRCSMIGDGVPGRCSTFLIALCIWFMILVQLPGGSLEDRRLVVMKGKKSSGETIDTIELE